MAMRNSQQKVLKIFCKLFIESNIVLNKTSMILRSNQNSSGINNLSLDRTNSSTYTPEGKNLQQTKVFMAQGQLNIPGPIKKPNKNSSVTAAQLAESAAVSAFEKFKPNTPLTTDTNFAPKISSTDIYSKHSAVATDFDSNVSSGLPTNKLKYETTNLPKYLSVDAEEKTRTR